MITNQIVTYPKKLWTVAKHIAKARSLLSENIYAEGTDKYRGEQEEAISLDGVRGELIVQWYMGKNYPEKETKFASLVDMTPQPEPDLISNDARIDIKTVGINKKFCNINANSQNNPDKKVNWYWCVNLLSENTCSFKMFEFHEVFFWEQKIGHNEYFSRRI